MIKEETDKLKTWLSNFQFCASENDDHQFVHTHQLVGISLDCQDLFSFFPVGMRSRIDTHKAAIDQSIFFVYS